MEKNMTFKHDKTKFKIITVLLFTVTLFLIGCDSKESTSGEADMFTDRDQEIGYSEESAIKISLNDGASDCSSEVVQIDGDTITITDEGTYILSGQPTNGMIIVDAEETDKLQLVLNGVEITSESSAAIYVRSADKVFITTAAGSDNRLQNGGIYENIDDNNIDAVIFSKDDLTINGAGTLEINAVAGHGVVSKDDLVFTSGTYNIYSEKHGLSGKDSVRIAEGTFVITAGKDGINASNDDDSSKGFVYISGGTLEINSGDDGVHADSSLTIEGGIINVTQSYEGLEGLSIDITGGNIEINASDDGLNAAGGSDNSGFRGGADIFAAEEGVYINISGGTLHVNAYGDGIDSNGDLTVSGGETYVSGPVNSANGALDYNGEAVISGGIFVAAGAAGMAQNFGNSSTQGTMLITVNTQEAKSKICLTDSDGNELVFWVTDKEYSSLLVSCPAILQGETYILVAGDETKEVTMDSLVYGSGGMSGMPGGQPGGQPGGHHGSGGFHGGNPPQDGEYPRDNSFDFPPN